MLSQRKLQTGLLLITLLMTACQGGQEGRDFDRLERLIFVPAAHCELFPETRSPVDCSNPRDLLVDRFEVTRGEWNVWLDARDLDSRARRAREFWRGAEDRYPATGMSLDEAVEFAAEESMRVPTAREWLRIAVGTRGQFFPWKPVPHASVANTHELGLAQLAPVGTFEAGRTPAGVYDLLGNAAEWVVSRDVRPALDHEDSRTWAMGGSFLSRNRATYRFDPDSEGSISYNAWVLDPGDRSGDVGVRLVADAESWLRERSPHWTTDAAGIKRLERIGRSWGSPAVQLLRSLTKETSGNPALEALLRGAQS